MQTINMHEVTAPFSQLLSRAHTGEETIVSKAGAGCSGKKVWLRVDSVSIQILNT